MRLVAERLKFYAPLGNGSMALGPRSGISLLLASETFGNGNCRSAYGARAVMQAGVAKGPSPAPFRTSSVPLQSCCFHCPGHRLSVPDPSGCSAMPFAEDRGLSAEWGERGQLLPPHLVFECCGPAPQGCRKAFLALRLATLPRAGTPWEGKRGVEVWPCAPFAFFKCAPQRTATARRKSGSLLKTAAERAGDRD
jgi:hypothetical protein